MYGIGNQRLGIGVFGSISFYFYLIILRKKKKNINFAFIKK